jgi:hypothetical protein
MKTEQIEVEKIANYVKVSREFLTVGTEADDFIYNQLTAMLHGYVYSMAKEEGEITVRIERPTFLDWLFRRTKTKKVKYVIRELVKADKMKFPDNVRVIQFPMHD